LSFSFHPGRIGFEEGLRHAFLVQGELDERKCVPLGYFLPVGGDKVVIIRENSSNFVKTSFSSKSGFNWK